jgi:hypothetical protein
VARNRRSGYVFRTADLDESKIEAMRQFLIDRLEPAISWAGEASTCC